MTRAFQIILWTLSLVLGVTLIAFLGGQQSAAVAVILSPLPALVVVLLVVQSGVALRRRRVAVVLSYLEQSVRLNLALPRMLTAAAASESGATARRIIAVRDRLEAGNSIAVSIQKGMRETPGRVIALIDAGERSGRLPLALDRLVRENRQEPREASDQAFVIAYPIAMTVAIVFIVGLLMVKVIPKYEQVLHDFRAPMPMFTMWLLTVTRVVVDNFVWLFAAFLAPVLVWFIYDQFSPESERQGPWLTGWFTRDRDLADVCRVVADSLDAHLPLDAALRRAGELSIGNALRWRLYRWAGGIERGVPAAEAARSAGMSKLITGLTATGEITAAREAFAFLARYYDSRFHRLRQLARGAAIPVMVFFFASIVGFVTLGLFGPMIQLIIIASPYRNSL